MISRGILPALGTDSLASSPSLDVLDDAFTLTSELGLSADLVVSMATHHGALALGLAAHGRIAKGARPGIFGVSTEVREGPAEALLLGRALPRARLDLPKQGVGEA
jgi:cytosine/adenosine deaminase-related metal-dependent hydrolase